MNDVALLTRAIDMSGLSAQHFAVRVLLRHERSMRRWLAGDAPLPEVIRDKLPLLIARCELAEGNLLRFAIDLSGLTDRDFADGIVLRDERTVRRWLSGESPMPQAVTARLREIVARGDLV